MGKPRIGSAKMTKHSDKFLCPCGGEVKMVNKFVNGKLRPSARCMKCGAEKRSPRDFRS